LTCSDCKAMSILLWEHLRENNERGGTTRFASTDPHVRQPTCQEFFSKYNIKCEWTLTPTINCF
jgi:hypothetical protein